jgi:hypothetical protein
MRDNITKVNKMQIYAKTARDYLFKSVSVETAMSYFRKREAFRDEIEFMYKDAQGIERELLGFIGDKLVVTTVHDEDTLYDWNGLYVRLNSFFDGIGYCGTKLIRYTFSLNQAGKPKAFWGVEVQGVIYAINYKK